MKNADKLDIRDVAGGAVITVKVVPGASRSGIVGALGERLKVATSAPPEGGKANAAVARIIAEALGLDSRSVVLVSSPSNPRKEFRVSGLSAQAIRSRLAEEA